MTERVAPRYGGNWRNQSPGLTNKCAHSKFAWPGRTARDSGGVYPTPPETGRGTERAGSRWPRDTRRGSPEVRRMSESSSGLNVGNLMKPANKKVEFKHDVVNTRLRGLCKVPTWRTGSSSSILPRVRADYGYSSWGPTEGFTFLPHEDDTGVPVGRRAFTNRTSYFCNIWNI